MPTPREPETPPPAPPSRFLRETRHFLGVVAEQTKLEGPVRESLANAADVMELTFPVQGDGGQVRHVAGYRVRHTTAFDMALGGLRLAPDVSIESSAARAMLQSWSNGLLGVPFGGAAGGVACDPRRLGAAEKQRVVRGLARRWCAVARVERDLFAPDAGTDARAMAWWLDEIGACGVKHPETVVVGKPLALGGNPVAEEAAAQGVLSVLGRFLSTQHRSLSEVRVAVQGFGAVGSRVARLLSQRGAAIVALSRSGSAAFSEAGIDVDAAAAFSRENGTLAGLPGADELSPEEAMACDCDVLIVAAAEGTLGEAIAPHVRAKTVVEAAFGATTSAADEVLRDNGVTILPDILAAAGGAVAGHLEWLQSRGHAGFERKQAEDMLQWRMEHAFDAVNARADEMDCDYRTAAYALALAHVVAALRLRGTLGP